MIDFLETSNIIKVFFLVSQCGFKIILPPSMFMMFMNNDITLGRSGITIKSTTLLTKIQCQSKHVKNDTIATLKMNASVFCPAMLLWHISSFWVPWRFLPLGTQPVVDCPALA